MLVYDVEAKDSDRNDNGIVDYGFYVNGVYTTFTNEFRINPITGVIRAEKVYDRETRDRYLVSMQNWEYGHKLQIFMHAVLLTFILMPHDSNCKLVCPVLYP